jgi:mannose-6-phosphate isomerase-like protein (cupin superfamily)
MSDYTILRRADAPDYTGDAPGAFLGYGRPLGSEQIALNVRVLEPGSRHVPPGESPDWGHSHRTIEEIYFVLEGEVEVKVGDEVETLGLHDAILVPPGRPRAFRNDSDERASVLMVSRKVEDPHAEAEAHAGFWP